MVYSGAGGEKIIQQLVDEHIFGAGRRCFIVRTGEKVLGLLTLHHIKKVPHEQWTTTTGEQIMIPLDEVKSVPSNEDLEAALQEMDRDGVNQLPVMTNGTVAESQAIKNYQNRFMN